MKREEVKVLYSIEIDAVSNVIGLLSTMIGKMNSYDIPSYKCTIFMPKTLRGIISAEVQFTEGAEEISREELTTFRGAQIVDGYENNIIVCNTFNTGRPNNPVLALENIGTPQMAIVERHKL